MAEARELGERHVRLFNHRSWERAHDLYAPDVRMTEPAGSSEGTEGYLNHAQGFVQAFPDSRMEVETVTEAGDRVVFEGQYKGTHTDPLQTPQGEVPPTGRSLSLPLCIVIEATAGRISSIHAYYDQMTFAAQLGLLPEPTKAGSAH